MTAKKKRTPPDLTLRNLRAMKKRIAKLERQHSALLSAIGSVVRELARVSFANMDR